MTLRRKTVLAALALVAPAGGAAGAESPDERGLHGPAGPPPGSVYERPAQKPFCELGERLRRHAPVAPESLRRWSDIA
jgi:hypothetical protein